MNHKQSKRYHIYEIPYEIMGEPRCIKANLTEKAARNFIKDNDLDEAFVLGTFPTTHNDEKIFFTAERK